MTRWANKPLAIANLRIIDTKRPQDSPEHYLTLSSLLLEHLQARPSYVLSNQVFIGRGLSQELVVQPLQIAISGTRHGNPYDTA
jgi:hypothetical protein